MITAQQYVQVIRMRYILSRFECAINDVCDHIYNVEGNALPSVQSVVAHLRDTHNLVH